MSGFTIEDLGLSQEELGNRVVERAVNMFLRDVSCNEDEQEYDAGPSSFASAMQERIRTKIDESIDSIAGKHVMPNMKALIESFCLQATNQWGDKTGSKMTFTEYLVKRAEAYMAEPVDYEGKTKAESRGYSGWSASGTRVADLVDKHLHYAISRAMEQALESANESIAGGLEEAVKVALRNATAKLKVDVKTK